eukprot:gene7566-7628_t
MAWAAGWAIGGLFQLPPDISVAIEILFVLVGCYAVFKFTRAALKVEPIRLAALGLTVPLTAGDAAETKTVNGLRLGDASSFSFESLKAEVKALAAKPYQAPVVVAPEILDAIDYEAHGKIFYRADHALFAEGPGEYPVTFFHLGKFFKKPVGMNLVQKENGATKVRPILYDPSYFDMPADSPAKKLPSNVGFAGFRYQEPRNGSLDWKKNDWVAFLGAAYFRAIGELFQYGLSARGIALDSAVSGRPEEFPDFTQFYIETPEGDGPVTLYARMEGPSIVGAYRFIMQRGKGVIMDIDASIHLREDIARLGIAPLTSMYWFSETAKAKAEDWRPEIHDSDGLALWTGNGDVFDLSYRLYWLADEPFPSPLGRVVATRLGNGGQPGQPRPHGVRKFMVEFLGGPLKDIPAGVFPEAITTTSRGTIGTYKMTEAVPDDVPGHWRTQFDLIVEGEEPVELRLFLKAGDQVLTETWAYQYHPF